MDRNTLKRLLPNAPRAGRRARAALRVTPIMVAIALSNASVAPAAEPGQTDAAPSLQDQVRSLTDEVRPPSAQTSGNADTREGATAAGADSAPQARYLRFGSGYESRMGIGSARDAGRR